jgi:hypothetical protein
MNIYQHLIAFLFLILTIQSCVLKPQEKFEISQYIDWVSSPQNGFVNCKDLNQIEFCGFYHSPEYQAIQVVTENGLSIDSISKLSQNYREWITFSFRIKSIKGTHPLKDGNIVQKEYFEKLQYYINAQSDFKLVIDDSDTLECSLYHFERNFGSAPYINVNIGFKRDREITNNVTLLYFDRVFSNGLIKYKYDEEKLNQLPEFIL